MSVVLALLAAVGYGTADFVGGIASGRASAWQVATAVMVSATLAAVPVGIVAGGTPTGSDWLLAVGGGAASGVGAAFLYRGLARGRMTVVAPLSGVVAAVIPVGVGLAQGDRPSTLALLGIVCAVPSIVLVAGAADEGGGHGHGGQLPPDEARAAIVDGLFAGAGFGLLFAASGSLSTHAGLIVMPALEFAGLVGVIVVAIALRESWAPRGRAAWSAWSAGVLALAAASLVAVASREGMLSVVAVIASLYPAVTVLLAAVLLRERVTRLQAVGLAFAAAAVALVAAG